MVERFSVSIASLLNSGSVHTFNFHACSIAASFLPRMSGDLIRVHRRTRTGIQGVGMQVTHSSSVQSRFKFGVGAEAGWVRANGSRV